MVTNKAKLDRNYKIVSAFTKKYPEAVKEMIKDLEDIGGTVSVPGACEADIFLFDDGICDNFEEVLTGKLSIQQEMACWHAAICEVLMLKLGIIPGDGNLQ